MRSILCEAIYEGGCAVPDGPRVLNVYDVHEVVPLKGVGSMIAPISIEGCRSTGIGCNMAGAEIFM